MKAILIGYGKMGQLLSNKLNEKGHKVLAAVDPFFSGKSPEIPVYASLEEALKGDSSNSGAGLKDADVVLEFTRPDMAVKNLLFLAKQKIPAVTGTTGWYDSLPEVSRAVDAAGSSLLWASNFSLGVNLFYRIAEYASRLMDPFGEYDVAGVEAHHNKKADSPSGTAKTLVERVLAQMTRKKKAVYEMLDRPPAGDELHYASVRVGSMPGVHNLIFDSPADTIKITHTVRNREGLAGGAILAAEWLVAKKRTGVFTVEDALADILPK